MAACGGVLIAHWNLPATIGMQSPTGDGLRRDEHERPRGSPLGLARQPVHAVAAEEVQPGQERIRRDALVDLPRFDAECGRLQLRPVLDGDRERLVEIGTHVLGVHVLDRLERPRHERVVRPEERELRELLALDCQGVLGLDQLVQSARGVGLRLQHGDRREKPDADAGLVLLDRAIGEPFRFLPDGDVLARADDLPVRVDDALDEVRQVGLYV